MSHFAVAVILKDINKLEEALAPFDENLEVPKYIEYTKAQAIKKVRDEIQKEKQEFYDKYLADKEAYKANCCLEHIKYLENEFTKKLNWTDEECYQVKARRYDGDFKDSEGNLYSTRNPNPKWDWWTLCRKNTYARFQNDKMPLGYCKLKDFDKNINENKYNHAIRFWEINVEGQPLKEGERKDDYFTIYMPIYYIRTFENKENYAKAETIPHYWAFVLNGEWYEKGEMGWFGMHNANKNSIELYLEKWLEVINNPEYQDYYIAIVDCHI